MRAAASVERRQVHLRRIACTGFLRDDGLWDIEGRLTDTKLTPLQLPHRLVEAEAAIHDMLVCLTIDRNFVIHAASARMISQPYGVCSEITQRYEQLVGIRIEPGFTQKVKRLFRGTSGCSHLTELLPPMATTAFQVLWSDVDSFDSGRGGSPLGGCHALRTDGEVVRVHFPEQFRPRT